MGVWRTAISVLEVGGAEAVELVMQAMHRNSLLESERDAYWLSESPVQFSWNQNSHAQHCMPLATSLPHPLRPQLPDLTTFIVRKMVKKNGTRVAKIG
jgi:hypothetical protein